ncbi:MAG: hypothetical protein JXQ67_05190 [Campylobacterales bacterium]|nr:hypothetical protein [Campylobacterales bacterium]
MLDIATKDSSNCWVLNGTFMSREFTSIIAKSEQLIKDLSELGEATKLLQEYYELAKDYQLTARWRIDTSSNGEYVLSLDGSDNPNKTWYSRNMERLLHIAFEKDLKDRVIEHNLTTI